MHEEPEDLRTDEETADDGTPAPDAGTSDDEAGGERSGKLVPVAEARRYRRRAQTAEADLAGARKELEARDAQIDEQNTLIQRLQRRGQIDDLLLEAGTIDLETARLLIERVVASAPQTDLQAAVDDIRRRKPYLFRRTGPAAAAQSPRANEAAALELRLSQAAADACESGRRQDLLRYLRLRRRR